MKPITRKRTLFRNTNTVLEAHADNGLAVIAPACCEQQVLTEILLNSASIGSPYLHPHFALYIRYHMYHIFLTEFENRLSQLRVFALYAATGAAHSRLGAH